MASKKSVTKGQKGWGRGLKAFGWLALTWLANFLVAYYILIRFAGRLVEGECEPLSARDRVALTILAQVTITIAGLTGLLSLL